MSLGTILLIVVILVLIDALPDVAARKNLDGTDLIVRAADTAVAAVCPASDCERNSG